MNSPLYRRLGVAGFGLLLCTAVSATGILGDYGRLLVATVAFNAIAVLSISTLASSTGIWSLGHTAFVALGAYMTANLAGVRVPIELIVPLVAMSAALLGYVLGLSAGRFSILYFGLLTMAVALTGMEIIGRLTSITGGDQGMAMPPIRSVLAGRNLATRDGLIVGLLLATLCFLVADLVFKGPRGRRWRAVKSHRMASISMGLVPHRENALAFALSASIAGVAGVAGGLTIGYLEPEAFNLDAGVLLIVATVIGGIGSFVGAILGAAFVVVVPEAARGLRDVSAFALGFVMVAVLLFLPRGIVPSVFALARKMLVPATKVRLETPVEPGGVTPDLSIGPKIMALATDLMHKSDRELRLEKVSVTFGGLKALQDISLTVAPGETIGLIGPNGAGKTTLLNVLSGYVSPSSCTELRLGAQDLQRVPPHRRLAAGFGRTFQHAELFSELTIREMLLIAAGVGRQQSHAGTDKVSPEEITQRILDSLGLDRVADMYPEEMPFGIQKVADIGRILAMGPGLVALDEPFSGLDSGETAELRAILRGMKAAGVSILIIDHAVQEVLDIADRVVVLDFGQVIAIGTPQEISRNAEVQRAYFGSVVSTENVEAVNA